MKLIFFIPILFFGLVAKSQDLYFIEELKKQPSMPNFGTSLISSKDDKKNLIYSFNKRLVYSEIVCVEDSCYILTSNGSLFIFKDTLVANLSLFNNINDVFFIKSNLKDNFFIGTYERKHEEINSSIDTLFIYNYNLKTRQKKLNGKYIDNKYVPALKENTFLVLYDIAIYKSGKSSENIKEINAANGKVSNLDSLFFDYFDSRARLNFVFNKNNIQIINDSICLVSYFKYNELKKSGRNFFIKINLNTLKKDNFFSIIDKTPVEGFFYDEKLKILYINNEQEICSINLKNNKKKSIYVMDKSKSFKLKYLSCKK